jgi:hypothetical protein
MCGADGGLEIADQIKSFFADVFNQGIYHVIQFTFHRIQSIEAVVFAFFHCSPVLKQKNDSSTKKIKSTIAAHDSLVCW